MDLRDELDYYLGDTLMKLESFDGSSKDRSDMVDDFCKLYRVRLDEKKQDNDFDREMLDGLKETKDKTTLIVGKAVDVGIALLKVGAMVFGYYICGRMHTNSIEADSYGVLQRSSSFKVIPKLDPGRDL